MTEKKNQKTNQNAAPVEPVAVVAEPRVEAVVEPVIATDAKVPTAMVERTEEEPLVEATAIIPNLVYEKNVAVADQAAAPQILTTKSANAARVEIICEGKLGTKLLTKGDITDDAEYVALLKTERGQRLVRKVS